MVRYYHNWKSLEKNRSKNYFINNEFKKMRIKPYHRKKLEAYLKQFYKVYNGEKYTIFHFIRACKERLKDNKDMWLGNCGATGNGKSYFGLICIILFGRRASLTNNVTYIPKGDEIMSKFDSLNFNVLMIDEAAKQMRKVQWQDKSQQKVVTKTMTDRYKSNMVIMNMPEFSEFTKSLKTGAIRFRAVILYRTKTYARVVIQRKSKNWRSDDAWKDKTADKKYEMLEKKKKEITNEMVLEIERSLPNTIMDFIIPNLELILPDITEEYKRLKIKSRDDESNTSINSTNKTNPYKDKYEVLMMKISKILYNNELDIGRVRTTKNDIATSIGCSVETLNKYLKKEPYVKRATK